MELCDGIDAKKPDKIKLTEINPYLTCYLCKGYLIDATTISECLHSFCRSCIIKFLQENSYCPVCEVIINKAKPNLKLDKTLQDIVYKLVPELFLKEMTRRKKFYQQYPQVAARVSPEERGEDMERIIFNPQDCISLSMEYIRDDSAPEAVRLLGLKNGLENGKISSTEDCDSIMKRYLQCPGMCRVEVLKKFVRNKYNVNTNLFYIDILYKRVPLPDHYTLIDIAYIYSWKRNEPMKFFFRITDINKVSERFDFFDAAKTHVDFLPRTPVRTRNNGGKVVNSSKKRDSVGPKKTTNKVNKEPSQENNKEIVKVCDKNVEKRVEVKIEKESEDKTSDKKADKHECGSDGDKRTKTESETDKNAVENTMEINSNIDSVKTSKKVESKILIKPNIVEQLKNKLKSEKANNKSYTNITLNRTDNVEIITKIQQVSNKEGQPIGHHIIKQTIKKTAKNSTPPKVPKNVPAKKEKKPQIKVEPKVEPTSDVKQTLSDRLEDEKSKFLKSIELTAKTTVENIVKTEGNKQVEVAKPSGGQKRKNSSPIKNDKDPKKPKIEKKVPIKIILHQKPKVADQKKNFTDPKRDTGLQSLIDSCKINIPSSLSITIKESSENTRSPTLIPPVKNYIEILKLPDEQSKDKDKMQPDATKVKDETKADASESKFSDDSEQKVDQDLSEIAKSLTEKIPISTTVSHIIGPKTDFQIPVNTKAPAKFSIQPSPVPEVPGKLLNVPKDNLKLNPRSPQTFQKIFEESLKNVTATASPQTAAELTIETNVASNNGKRNILEIASQLYKKTKLEQEKTTQNEEVSLPKVPIPRLPNQRLPNQRLPNQRTVKPPRKASKPESEPVALPQIENIEPEPAHFPQSVANLHSSSLGMNYTVSVGQKSPPKPLKVNGIVSPVTTEANTNVAETEAQSQLQNDSKGNLVHDFKLPPGVSSPKSCEMLANSPRPNSIPRNLSPVGCNSPKHSPKSSPVIKHMYAPMPVPMYNQKIPSPMTKFPSVSPKLSPNPPKLPSPSIKPLSSPKLPSTSPKPVSNPAKLLSSSPKPPLNSPKLPSTSPKPALASPKLPSTSPKPVHKSPKLPCSPKTNSSTKAGTSQPAPLSPNEILEKYNIQNLAQFTASLNFNAANFGMNPTSQLAAFQHAMLLKHIEMQNRQNWLNMNQGPLLQYEKYLQSLNGGSQNHLLGNIKEN